MPSFLITIIRNVCNLRKIIIRLAEIKREIELPINAIKYQPSSIDSTLALLFDKDQHFVLCFSYQPEDKRSDKILKIKTPEQFAIFPI